MMVVNSPRWNYMEGLDILQPFLSAFRTYLTLGICRN